MVSDINEARDDLATPAPMAGVKVKPLEWAKDSAAKAWVSESPWGVYGVFFCDGYGWLCDLDGYDDSWVKYPVEEDGFESDESAKAAAQAHYEARILSALEPAPVTLADALALMAEREARMADVARLRKALATARSDALDEAIEALGHHVSDDADAALRDMWVERIDALKGSDA